MMKGTRVDIKHPKNSWAAVLVVVALLMMLFSLLYMELDETAREHKELNINQDVLIEIKRLKAQCEKMNPVPMVCEVRLKLITEEH